MTNLTRRLMVLGLAVGAVAVLWVLFGPLTTSLAGSDLDRLGPKERIDAVNTIRGQVATVLSAVFVAGGLYYTGRKFFLDRDKQFTDRFNAAVDHIAGPHETGRAGGIRALDRILSDSPRDRDRVLETITGFLRHHTRPTEPKTADAGNAKPEPVDARDDLSAAVAVLRTRRTTARKVTEQPLDLRRVRLIDANLRGAHLASADLTGADLSGATLVGADLSDSRLGGATLIGVSASNARLRHALLSADFTGADLTGADCTGADLSGATLTGATLDGTILTAADLAHANLCGTDLSRARGLATDQLRLARADERTRVPDGIDHPR